MFKPPMLANKYEARKAKFPLYAEPKLDGMRLIVVVADQVVLFFSRTGKAMYYDSYTEELVKLTNGNHLIFDTELMARDFKETMEQGRRQSNRDETNLNLHIFDVVPIRGWLAEDTGVYTARKALLRNLFKNAPQDKVKMVDWHMVCYDDASVQTAHDVMVKLGHEGVMLKRDAPYAWKRSNDLLKLKRRKRYTALVIGFQVGEGKHEGRLGALEVDLNGTRFFVGTGFDDAQRQHIWNNQEIYLGMLVNVLGQETTEVGAVRFPVFEGWADAE